MKAIIRWSLWMRRWSTMWWSIAVSTFILVNMVFYPTFQDQAAQLEKSFADLPDAALQLFGGSADFFSPVGFLNSQIFFLMLPLLLGALAITLGSSLLGREEQDKTIELLLARPFSRSKILSGKALAGIIILTTVTGCSIAVTILSTFWFDVDVGAFPVLIAGLSCWLLALATGAIAFMLTSTGKARGAAVGIAALIGVGGYIISSLAGTVEWLTGPSKVFPFHYYAPEAILNESYNWWNMLFPIAVIAICTAVSYMSFRRRDIS